ncbi:ankyrin repeat domain-containing protein [Rickettsiales endosymbiont of Stachyamoeba lipophora]|uniref:ankyrin repeat domain-containing protein n=1 Tax=Rickettsiales endosymbiont of Stachyamoeba lipophora TaxID=2486578 RepID=UPI000F652DC7|nr:ankyrin repeat domain-containing protein [Rickettsiales endosymbiont of Stachyamoeba lipophora]AZL15950.1 ankyrin repeat domain-containing protein [Rickettsiales endosymbiont of Stachyamoeba lipophora]
MLAPFLEYLARVLLVLEPTLEDCSTSDLPPLPYIKLTGDFKNITNFLKELTPFLNKIVNHRCFKVLKTLLFKSMDSNGNTLLHYAAATGHLRILQTLLNINNNPEFFENGILIDLSNIFNNSRSTPLHHAAFFSQDTEALKLVIQLSINLNVKDGLGSTPIISAIGSNNLQAINILVDQASIDCSIINNNHYSALDLFKRSHSLALQQIARKLEANRRSL